MRVLKNRTVIGVICIVLFPDHLVLWSAIVSKDHE